MILLPITPPAVCLVLQPEGEVRWERVPADLSRIEIPPLLRITSYSFMVTFSADIRKRRLVNITDIHGPSVGAPDWASKQLPKVRLGSPAARTTGHFRLCMNLSDPHLEQQALH